MRIRANLTILSVGMIFGVLFTAGCADFEEQKPLTSGTSQIWMRVASQAIENGHPDTAIRFAKKAVIAAPESDAPLRILARAYRQKSRLAQNQTMPADPMVMPSVVVSTTNDLSRRQGAIPHSLVAPTGNANKERAKFVSLTKQITSPHPDMSGSRGLPTYKVQLAAYADLDDAVRGLTLLTRRLPSAFPRLGIFVRHRLKSKGRGVNYRLRSRDLTSRSQAVAFCMSVRAAGISCLPIRHARSTWQLVMTNPTLQTKRSARPRLGSDFHVRANKEDPVTKPVTITVRPSPVTTAPVKPVAGLSPPLFRIQLAAYRDLARAIHGKNILTNSLPEKFPRLEILKKIGNTKNAEPINYWLRSRGLWHKSHARALCDRAQSAGHACFLTRGDSTVWRPVVANR